MEVAMVEHIHKKEASMNNEFPFSEQYRVAGEGWVDLEYAAHILEDTKSSVMAQMQVALGDIPVNRAEQTVKASKEWIAHVESIALARKNANLARVNMDVAKLRYYENQSREANVRAEMKL